MYADSLKMASWQPIPRFSPEDLVTYRGETTCLVDIPALDTARKLAPKRFKTKSEVDELAKRRTEKSTDRQTEWAVRIFRGQF